MIPLCRIWKFLRQHHRDVSLFYKGFYSPREKWLQNTSHLDFPTWPTLHVLVCIRPSLACTYQWLRLTQYSKQIQPSAKNNYLILRSHSFTELTSPLRRKEADIWICIWAGLLAGKSGGSSNSSPPSEWGCVCVHVRTDRWVAALKNAQCFLYLSVKTGWLRWRKGERKR